MMTGVPGSASHPFISLKGSSLHKVSSNCPKSNGERKGKVEMTLMEQIIGLIRLIKHARAALFM